MKHQFDSHAKSFSWFSTVGALAAAVHYVIAVILAAGCGLAPTRANILGFLSAFPVSYFGHRQFSFVALNAPHKRAFPRFFAIACAGFFENQMLLIVGMRSFALPFWFLLLGILLIVAVSTYLLSRFWAFGPA